MERYAPPWPENPELDRITRLIANSPEIERRIFLKRQHYPRFLYKYRSFDPRSSESIRQLTDILVWSRLWLSSPVAFNDPFDMSAKVISEGNVKGKRERLMTLAKRHGHNWSWKQRQNEVTKMMVRTDEDWARIAKDAFSKNIEQSGVCSFTEDPRSILMWSHYANHHQGLCLQFEIAQDPGTLLRAVNVEYNDQYPVLNWMEETAEQITPAMLRKHPNWAYEAEHRIVVPGGANSYLLFPAKALRAVILGCRANEQVVEAINNLLQERNAKGLPALRMYFATKHDSLYKLRLMGAPTFLK